MYDSATPQNFKYPSPFDMLDGLDRMIMLRTLRPDKVSLKLLYHSLKSLNSFFGVFRLEFRFMI